MNLEQGAKELEAKAVAWWVRAVESGSRWCLGHPKTSLAIVFIGFFLIAAFA